MRGQARFTSGWIIGIAAVCSALLRYVDLSQTPYANGWDAYFYLIQVRSWAETGCMHSPEASLIYPLLRAFVWLTHDYVLAYKYCAAFLAGLFTCSTAFAVRRLSDATPLVCVAVAWTVFSPHLAFFAAQYPKNLMGASFLLFFIGALSDAFRAERLLSVSALVSALLFALHFFTHRFTFAVAAIYGVGVFLFEPIVQKNALRLSGKRMLWGAAALAALSLAAFMGFKAPGLLHWSDWERLSGVLAPRPHFAPLTFVREWGSERISAAWMSEIWLASGFFLWAVAQILLAPKNAQSAEKALLVVGLILLFPFLKWSLTGISYRFFLLFVLLGPLFFLMAARPFGAYKKTCYAFAGLLLLAAPFSRGAYRPAMHDPDYRLFEQVSESLQGICERNGVCPELLIAHNALAEYITFATRRDAMPWAPEYDLPPEKLWRVATDIKMQELRYYLAQDRNISALYLYELPGPYCMIREDQWRQVLAAAQTAEDEDFLERAAQWNNPSRIRPAFLLRRKQ